MTLPRMPMFRNRAGFSLIEIMAAVTLSAGIILAVATYLIFSYKMSVKNRGTGATISNVQNMFSLVQKKVHDVDNLDLDTENRVFFRWSYIAEGSSYDGTTDTLRSRWGCFYFDPDEEELRYFESNEVAFGASSGLIWTLKLRQPSLVNVSFEYDDPRQEKKLVVTIEYQKNESDFAREMVFVLPKAQPTPDRVNPLEAPQWEDL